MHFGIINYVKEAQLLHYLTMLFIIKKILKNRSYIFYIKNNRSNVNEVINKFNDHFPVFPVEDFKEVDNILKQNNITHIYIIKSGTEKHLQSKVAKNCIHCVFHTHSKHGDVYSSIHEMVPGNKEVRSTL